MTLSFHRAVAMVSTMPSNTMLGTFGVWGPHHQWAEKIDEIAEIESLGFGTFWIGSSPGMALVEQVVNATRSITVATGIINVWQSEPEDVAAEFHRLGSDRVLL